ncbi:MAG TPA: AMP-binding protein, partial [Candidatus Acidoferrales bacterium]|nr:AMP-binding protein [Candidatus Acidoferrales bacterium]
MKAFLAARDLLFECREDYERARREFRWPRLTTFNWALDYFDDYARGNRQTALWIAEDGGADHRISFEEMSRRSNQVARFLRRRGVERGDRIILMLPNVAATWEMILAAMKLGAVVIPAATLLTTEDLRDRLERGKARHVVAMAGATERFAKLPGDYTRIVVSDGVHGEVAGW